MAAYRRVDDLRSPAGWLPIHRDQLRAQRSVSTMGSLYLYLTCMWCVLLTRTRSGMEVYKCTYVVMLETSRGNRRHWVLWHNFFAADLTSLESRRDQISRSLFKNTVSHLVAAFVYLHSIRDTSVLSRLGTEHGSRTLSYAPKYCSFINYALNHYQVRNHNNQSA